MKKFFLSALLLLLVTVFSLPAQALTPGPGPAPAPDPYASCTGFQKAQFYSSEYLYLAIRADFYPFTCGTVHIGGWNMDAVYSVSNKQPILLALQGNPMGVGLTIDQLLNQEYLAAQLSMLQFGGVDVGPRKTPLKCYGFTNSVVLSNGHLITPETQLGALFDETYSAFRERRYDDYLPLWNFFWRLNGGDLPYPHYIRGDVDDATYCCQGVSDQGNGIVSGTNCEPIKDWLAYKCQAYSFSCKGELASPAGVTGCKVVP